MLISVCGSQGQGKTTVLSSLQDYGYKTIQNKTARSILSEWGVKLEEVYSDKELSVKFHETILERHNETCSPYYKSDELCFIERSFADIFTYALCVLGPFNQYDKWLSEFYYRCSEEQSKYAAVFYLTGRTYVPENDGVRSTNIHFSRMVDVAIKKYLNDFSNNTCSHRVFEVHQASNDDRVNFINNIIHTYFKD